jgi:hypothetical protein
MRHAMRQSDSPACQRAREYGIDLSMIRENLRLSVMERLQRHQSALNTALQLRSALRQANDRPSQAR